jgi:ABC-type polysaccharide/polyol phosphate export permease
MNAKTAESHPTILQYRELLKNLVIKDLKVKYRNSFLGFLWSLLNPLMMIIVYSVALKYILRVQVENFPALFDYRDSAMESLQRDGHSCDGSHH